jgi:hypothetical protein
MDVIPTQLAEYNIDKGFGKTPFGTYYKLFDKLNLHLEVLTFRTLIESVEKRHTPFFDKLFKNNNELDIVSGSFCLNLI